MAREWCVGFSRLMTRMGPSHEATLKRAYAFRDAAAPAWWQSAAAKCEVARSEAIAGVLGGGGGRPLVTDWARARCDAFAARWAGPGAGALLVFDVGLANGEDTELFLSRGHRVVAVEANPNQARAARDGSASPPLRRAIEEGSLVVENVAIVRDAEATASIKLRVPSGNTEVASVSPDLDHK